MYIFNKIERATEARATRTAKMRDKMSKIMRGGTVLSHSTSLGFIRLCQRGQSEENYAYLYALAALAKVARAFAKSAFTSSASRPRM